MSFPGVGGMNIFDSQEPRKREFVFRTGLKPVWLNIVCKGEKYRIRQKTWGRVKLQS